MNKILKQTFVLAMITIVAGLSLGFVYELTKEPIAKAKKDAKNEACKEVFSDADDFATWDAFDAKAAADIMAKKGFEKTTIDEVSVAKKGDKTLGYVIAVTNGEGYGGDLKYTIGINDEGKITGISFLSLSESPGLGMEAKDNKNWKTQFENKKQESFSVVKNKANSDNQVEAISGATITSKAVTNGVNGALAYFREALKGGSKE